MPVIRNEEDIREGLAALAMIDPRLAAVIAAAGPVPLRLMQPGFAGLAHIVVSQVVTRASAEAIWRRILAAGPVTAETYLAHDESLVASFGLSRAKAATLAGLAHAVCRSGLDLEQIARLEPESAMAELTALPGIGPWTAEVYLMFCGGHADLFPAGDVALQASVARAFALPVRPSGTALAAMAQGWRPWRAVAARLFWAYYAVTAGKDAAPTAS